jgi:thiamine phosphate synthase YjbQ (UPF0047 family)
VFINDDEYGLHQDYGKWLEELAPHAPIRQYQHNRTGEACPEHSRGNNTNAHLKRQVMGRKVVVKVTNGRLDKAAPGGCLILSFRGGVSPYTHPENIDALLEAARTWSGTKV